jgi:hypothetical protein
MQNKVSPDNDSEREHAMSKPAVSALAPLLFELVFDDGEPLETEWHTYQLPLLRDLIRRAMAGSDPAGHEGTRQDRFLRRHEHVRLLLHGAGAGGLRGGGERSGAAGLPRPRRLLGRRRRGLRAQRLGRLGRGWAAAGRDLRDAVPSTAKKDRTEKRDLYAELFRTAEYFLYEPETRKLEGLRLAGRAYRPIRPDGHGRLWSEKLGLFVGVWTGPVEGRTYEWVRLFRPDGSLVLTNEERAEAAEAELARLRALLEERGST